MGAVIKGGEEEELYLRAGALQRLQTNEAELKRRQEARLRPGKASAARAVIIRSKADSES